LCLSLFLPLMVGWSRRFQLVWYLKQRLPARKPCHD
jgi:hypothetical protein